MALIHEEAVYTPGPWSAEAWGEDGWTVEAKGYVRIASVTHFEDVYGNEHPQEEANARLLAAAPPLLEAAQRALLALASCGLGGNNGQWERKLERQLRAAITTATGMT